MFVSMHKGSPNRLPGTKDGAGVGSACLTRMLARSLGKKKRYGKEIVDVSPDGRAGGRARPSLELLSFQPELPAPLVGLCMFPPPCCCKGETNCSSMAGLIACSTRCCSGPGCLRRLRPGVSQCRYFHHWLSSRKGSGNRHWREGFVFVGKRQSSGEADKHGWTTQLNFSTSDATNKKKTKVVRA